LFFATWPAVRKGPSLTVVFPSGKVGARGHFSNCCYQTSAGGYILSWVLSFLLAQGPCSSSVLLTAPVSCFTSFLLITYVAYGLRILLFYAICTWSHFPKFAKIIGTILDLAM